MAIIFNFSLNYNAIDKRHEIDIAANIAVILFYKPYKILLKIFLIL